MLLPSRPSPFEPSPWTGWGTPGMSFMDSLLQTLLSSSSLSAEEFWCLGIEFPTWNVWLFFPRHRESQLFFPPTAIQDESLAQWNHSPNHPRWAHLPLFIFFLSPGMPFSTDTTYLSDTAYLWIPSFPVFHPMSSCSYSACVIYLGTIPKLPFYCYLTFLVFLFKSILIMSKHLLDTYCVPGNTKYYGYISMNNILS